MLLSSCCFFSTGVLREVTTHFIVDARAHYKSGGSHIKACISNPSGSNTDAYITDKGDGTYRVEYTPYEDGEALKVLFSVPLHVPGGRRWSQAQLQSAICFW